MRSRPARSSTPNSSAYTSSMPLRTCSSTSASPLEVARPRARSCRAPAAAARRALRSRAPRARSARAARACGSSRSRPGAAASCRAGRRARVAARRGRRSNCAASSSPDSSARRPRRPDPLGPVGAERIESVGVVRVGVMTRHALCSSSSTISASATSSSDGAAPASAPGAPARLLRLHVLVQPLRELLARRDQRLVRVLIASTSVPASVSFSVFSASSIFLRSSAGTLSPCSFSSFSVWYASVSAVLRVSASSRLALVLLGVRLGVLDHLVDVVLAERGAAGDDHRLLLARAEILGRHVHDAVGVDVERDLDLRHAARCRRQAGERERAQRLVAVRHVALALQHLDLHRRLVVVGGREHLRTLHRDRAVALDELRHDLTLGLDAERQRRDVEQQDVLDVALQHAGLDRRTGRNRLVGVDALVRLLAGELVHEVGDRGHARAAADEDHVVDLRLVEPGVPDRLLERAAARLEQVARHLLEPCPRERELEVQRTVARRGDERQVDRGLLQGRQLDLRLLGRFLQALRRPSCRWRGRRRARS